MSKKSSELLQAKSTIKSLIQTEIASMLMLELSAFETEQIYEQIVASIEQIEQLKSSLYDHLAPLDYPKVVFAEGFRKDQAIPFDNNKGLLACAAEIEKDLVKV